VDDTSLGRLLGEWGLLKEPELAEAREIQARLKLAGGHPSLENVLVDFGFLTKRQLEDALAVTEGLPAPGDELPPDVVEASHDPSKKFGHFLLLNEIGRGGLGVVHRAWDTELRCVLALKFLRSEASLDPTRVIDLLHEGSRLSRLRHPNIITVHEFGRIRNQFYIAMDLLEGMGLDALVRSAKARNQMSPFYDQPKRYLAIFRDIARAVHYTHSRTPPLLHCDLKPQNIFVDFSWRPYLVDFGVARELRHDVPGGDTAVKGSPAYMAPEQVLGKTDEIDVRTDVYGLGAILYELLTGRPPIVAETVQQALDQNLLVDPPPPSRVVAARVAISTSSGAKPSVPAELEAICMRCISRDRKDRFQTAREVAEAVDPLVGDKPLRVRVDAAPVVRQVEAPAPAAPERRETVRRRVRRALRRAGLVGFGLGVALIGVAAIALLRMSGGGPSKAQARATAAVEMDAIASRLDIEAAQEGYSAFCSGDKTPECAAWVQPRLEELEWMRRFRDQLALTVGRERPTLGSLKLKDGELRDPTILSASAYQLVVFATSERTLRWAQIMPEEIVRLAFMWPDDFTGKTRLGLAIYAIKNRLWPEAKTVLKGLEDPLATKYLGEIPGP
jgi:hypothetical protein